MKTILLSLFAELLFATSATTDKVFICNGPKSEKYHLKENCRGLRNCSTQIEKVPIEDAKKKGRTICGYED